MLYTAHQNKHQKTKSANSSASLHEVIQKVFFQKNFNHASFPTSNIIEISNFSYILDLEQQCQEYNHAQCF